MSEEQPAKPLNDDNNDDAVLTDATDASNLSDSPDLPVLPEASDMATDSEMLAAASQGIISMEDGTDMVEERLHDSLESQGQEEWLSEDVLTDDDFNTAADAGDSQTSQPEKSQSEASPNANNIMEHEQTEPEPEQAELELAQAELEPAQAELEPEKAELEPKKAEEPIQAETEPQTKVEALKPEPKEAGITDSNAKGTEHKVPDQNIEDALNTLEGGPEMETALPDLDSFLIKKPERKDEKAEEVKIEGAKEQDDGNDTDDLLRMLSEDNSKSKKLTKTVKDVRNSAKNKLGSSDDDDDFVFEGASAKKLKLTKKPEGMDFDCTDQSSDGEDAIQKMFIPKKPSDKSLKPQNGKPMQYLKSEARNIVNVVKKERLATSTPLRAGRPRSLLKAPHSSLSIHQLKIPNSTLTPRPKQAAPKAAVKTPSILKLPVPKQEKKEPDTNEEFLEDEDFHIREEEFESDDETTKNGQRIIRPERMDSVMASDGDSHSEDGSIYDELPSSESDDGEDWFQLDIRAEKAGDYLPLLGPNAKKMLLEEKTRVSARLATLKQSLSALTDSGKKQADQVRTATMALAELDDMLKAS